MVSKLIQNIKRYSRSFILFPPYFDPYRYLASLELSSCSISQMELMQYAKIMHDTSIQTIVMNTSFGACGVISPYPTVKIVVTAQ